MRRRPRNDVEAIADLARQLLECRNWIEDVVRCYDRDNVPERRKSRPSGVGVLVFLTDTKAEHGRDLLRPLIERKAVNHAT